MLWELLTGQQYLPISGLDPSAGLALVRHPKPMPPSTHAPWIAPELDKVVLRGLAPDRQQRYQSAEEMLIDIETVQRSAFKPAGQTELKRWLAKLQQMDGMVKGLEAAPVPPASLPPT